ncbi:MAG: hypothetical protein KJ006_10300 [Thermoleophilia bacterium]|nr:hypothetical protein [Thermoleophilia bacterium]
MQVTHPRTLIAAGAAALAVAIGAGAAIAASGTGGNGDVKAAAERLGDRAERKSDLASRLGVTVAELESAVQDAARERIDAAAAAGDITAAEAKALEAELEDGRLARELARPADIAENLGVTEDKLETALAESHKAAMEARIDQAVADGMITAEYAAELKQRVDEADLSDRGFGPGGPGRHGFGPGLGFGLGFGPGLDGAAGDVGSGASA